MKIKCFKAQNGFTLIEVLIAASIFAGISTIVLSVLIQDSNLWQLITNQSDLRSGARNAMDFMAQELRNTTRTSSEIPSPNISIPAKPNNNSITFYLPRDNDGNGFIIDSLGSIEWDKTNQIQHQYNSSLKQLRRLKGGQYSIIANNVVGIEFEDRAINPVLRNDELRINLTLRKLTPQNRTLSVTLTSRVKLRN